MLTPGEKYRNFVSLANLKVYLWGKKERISFNGLPEIVISATLKRVFIIIRVCNYVLLDIFSAY